MLVNWYSILVRSITDVVSLPSFYLICGDNALKETLQNALQSRVASLHFPMHYSHFGRLPDTLLASDLCDLAIAAAYASFRYLEANHNRIRRMSDSSRDELVSLILRSLIENTNVKVKQSSDDRSHAKIQQAVNAILCENDRVSSFHLGVFIRLCYKEMPEFLIKQLSRSLDELWEMLQISYQNPFRPRFADTTPLFLWACDANHSWGDYSYESQLQVLLTLGVNIDHRDESDRNVVHWVISEHIVRHGYLEEHNELNCMPDDDLVPALEKLYLVERAGADFKHQVRHRTPLQACRHGLDRIRKTSPDKRNFEDLPEDRFGHLEWALEHKELTGHLPQPYLGREYRHPRKDLPRTCDVCSASHSGTDVAKTNINSALPIALSHPRPPPLPPFAPGPPPQLAKHPASTQLDSLPQSTGSTTLPATPSPRTGGSIPLTSRSRTGRKSLSPGDATSRSRSSTNVAESRRQSKSPQPLPSPHYLTPTKSSLARVRRPSHKSG